MELIPTQRDVQEVLESTGALRRGHFRHPGGLHSDVYLQLPLVMQHYAAAKTLSVGLSRLLRRDDEVRRALPHVSVVVPATGGLPVAYGVAEALRADQTYWAEKNDDGKLAFRQFQEVKPGEKIVLVDDLLRTGKKLSELYSLVEKAGAQVLALAVLVVQPFADCREFPGLPLFTLLRLDPNYWTEKSCPLCAKKVPATEVKLF